MPRKKRHKIHDPAKAAREAAAKAERKARADHESRHNPAAWGTNADALSLVQNADVLDEAGSRTRGRRVSRYDCFALLNSRGALGDKNDGPVRLRAVRRLEDEIAKRLRVERPRADVYVDSSGRADALSHEAIEAAKAIERVLSKTGALSSRLLLALCEPPAQTGQPVNNWRDVVKRVTGEPYEHGQVAVVRAACQNLVEAWAEVDNQPRRVAA